ncbi:MAG: 5'-nucleotidase C-terminal domain-containing protein, partial [Kofleriaceae bacterium]
LGLLNLLALTIHPLVCLRRPLPFWVFRVPHAAPAPTLAVVDDVPGIDLVLSGDTHERIHEPIRRGDTLVVEPGGFASLLGRVDIELVAGARPRLRWRLLELRADRYAEDPRVAEVVRAALAPWQARADAVIARTEVPLERYGVVDNSADDLLVDAIRAAAGTEIALSNGFRFGHPIEPGPIRERDLWMLFPVSTQLRTGTVTGRQLRAFWEDEIDHVFAEDPRRLFGGWMPRVSGMAIRFRTDRPRGQRVTSILVHGRPLDDDRVYTIAACEREGDAEDTLCRIRGIASPRTLELDVHAAVRAQLAAAGSITAPFAPRVVAEDLPAHVLSQFERR